MSTELKPVDGSSQLPAVQQAYGDDIFGLVSTSGKYLPRIQLYGGNSGDVKEGKIAMAHFGLAMGKSLTDLGKEFDCLPMCWRPKAMELGESIITVFDPKDPEFARIQKLSEVKDSGCMFGPEFLMWVPAEQQWAAYFANNKTAQRAAGELKPMLGKPVTVRSIFIKTTKYSWHGPEFGKCSTPFAMPTNESVLEEVEKFNNPPKSEIEKVAPEATARPR